MRRLLLALALLAMAIISAALLLPGVFTSHAQFAETISGDTNIMNAGHGGTGPDGSGNFYTFDDVANSTWDPSDANTETMRMGPIDECSVVTWTAVGTDNIAVVDMVIQSVTDLTGYQVRINFDQTKVNFLDGGFDLNGDSTGFVPFRDRKSLSQKFVSFINLPVEDQTLGHRSDSPLTDTAIPGSVLIGDTYLGARTTALSADTPSSNAPEGGLLVRTAWELLPDSDGQVVSFDVASLPPPPHETEGPGTKTIVADPGGGADIVHVLPESALNDFRIASDGPAAGAPSCGAAPTPTAAAGTVTGTATVIPSASTPSGSPGAGTPTGTSPGGAQPASHEGEGGGGGVATWVYLLIAGGLVVGAVAVMMVWRLRRRPGRGGG